MCSRVPKVSEGDIWWASVGENVGWEINGKSQDFTRPVIVFRKFSEGFYFVIPATTQKKTGSWYVPYRQKSFDAQACLQQARSIDYRRLHSKIGQLDEEDFRRIAGGFFELIFKNFPHPM